MDNSELLAEINNWRVELGVQTTNQRLIELAFFKIFVKFEKFLSEIFIHYSLGKKSSKGFKPLRKLGFKTPDQLFEIIKGSKNTYIDFPKLIPKISHHIFKENQNPFTIVFDDAGFSEKYVKMQYMRNHIAHESIESKNKYLTSVLMSYSIREYKPIYEFLIMVNRHSADSYYSIFVNKLKDFSDILVEPQNYLS